MTTYVKSKYTFTSDNRGSLRAKAGSVMSVAGTTNLTVTGASTYAAVSQTAPLTWTGICMSGLEFTGSAYVPKDWDLNHWKHLGINIIRLPWDWERMQPTLLGDLDSEFVGYVRDYVTKANSLGITVILDCHSFGKFDSSVTMTQGYLSDLWTKVAAAFNDLNVQYDLMNEPGSTVDAATQVAIYNACISAIRAVSSTKIIHIPLRDANTLRHAVDEYTSFVSLLSLDAYCYIQAHVYFDANGTGTSDTPLSDYQRTAQFQMICNFARLKGFKLFIGELGTGYGTTALTCLNNFLDVCAKNSDVVKGFTYWADGGSWSSTYVNAVNNSATGYNYSNGDVVQKYLITGAWTNVFPVVNSFTPAITSGTASYSANGVTGASIHPTYAGSIMFMARTEIADTDDLWFMLPTGFTIAATNNIMTGIASDATLSLTTALKLTLNSSTYATALSTNTLYHIRVIRTASSTTSATLTMYLNGTQIYTGTRTVSTTGYQANPTYGGSTLATSLFANGAILKGFAHYFSNKGVPTAADIAGFVVPTGAWDSTFGYAATFNASGATTYR